MDTTLVGRTGGGGLGLQLFYISVIKSVFKLTHWALYEFVCKILTHLDLKEPLVPIRIGGRGLGLITLGWWSRWMFEL